MTILEVNGSCPDYRRELNFRGSPSDHEYPMFTSLNGTLMARPRSVHIWSLAGRRCCGALSLGEGHYVTTVSWNLPRSGHAELPSGGQRDYFA